MILTMQRRLWTTEKYNKKWFSYRTIMREAFWFQMEENGGGGEETKKKVKRTICLERKLSVGEKCWRHKDMGALLVSLSGRPIIE
jgi:hypothetical protein